MGRGWSCHCRDRAASTGCRSRSTILKARNMRSLSLVRILAALVLLTGVAAAADSSSPSGQRVFYTGHSFHMFVPRNVEQIVKAAGVQGYKNVGQQGIGGS